MNFRVGVGISGPVKVTMFNYMVWARRSSAALLPYCKPLLQLPGLSVVVGHKALSCPKPYRVITPKNPPQKGPQKLQTSSQMPEEVHLGRLRNCSFHCHYPRTYLGVSENKGYVPYFRVLK